MTFQQITSILLIGTLSIFSSSIQAQNNLDDYLQLAVENNPGVQAEFIEYYAALEEVPQVGSLPDPQVMLGYYILPVETRVGPRNFDISIRQSFPWFGTLEAKKSLAEQRAIAALQDFEVAKNELFYEVRTIYYQLWLIDRSIANNEEYLHILDLDEESTIARVEAAKSSLADVLRIQMEREEIMEQNTGLEDQRTTLEAEMNALLDRPLQTSIDVDSALTLLVLNTDDEALIDSIMVNHPSIHALEEQQLVFDYEQEVAQKKGMPTFGLGISYASVSRRKDVEVDHNGRDMLMPTATISIPLYRKQYRAMIKEAEYRKQGIQHQIDDKKNTLAKEWITAVNKYRDAERKSKLYTELLKKARETLDILTTSYAVGREDYEEVLRMQRQLLAYQLSLEEAKAKQNISVAQLEKLLAKPL